jgi:hypothetical protein
MLNGLQPFTLWHFGEAARSDAQIDACSRRCQEAQWWCRPSVALQRPTDAAGRWCPLP